MGAGGPVVSHRTTTAATTRELDGRAPGPSRAREKISSHRPPTRTAKTGQMTGNLLGTVGWEGRFQGAKSKGAIECPVQAHGLELAGADRNASAPHPQGAIQRPELGKAPPGRINDRCRAGHRLTDR